MRRANDGSAVRDVFKVTVFYPDRWFSNMMPSMKTLTGIVVALAIVLYAPSHAPAAQGQTQTLIVTVVNSTGQYVPNLNSDDFIVEEDGVPQRLSSFSRDSDLPVSLGILIDKSASMRLPVAVQGRERIPAALLAADGAARVVVRLMKPQDEYLIMLFDENPPRATLAAPTPRMRFDDSGFDWDWSSGLPLRSTA